MRRCFVLLALVIGAVCAWAGEVGTRLELEGVQPRGLGWTALSLTLGSATLTGRAEWNLFPLGLRRAGLHGSSSVGPFTLHSEAYVLAPGRVNLAGGGSWKGQWNTFLGLVSLQGGGKVALADALGVRFPSALAWGSVRVDVENLWVETGADFSWPGGLTPGEVRMGLSGERWIVLSLSVHSIGLELGASQGRWTAVTFLAFPPVTSQAVSLSYGDGDRRLQGRFMLRPGGLWSAAVNFLARQSPWSASVAINFTSQGLDKASLEMVWSF